MSLFRAVRSLVTRGRDNEEQSPSYGEGKSNATKTMVDQASQVKIDKVKSLWALYSNVSEEHERSSHLHKLVPRFVQVYKDKEFQVTQDT